MNVKIEQGSDFDVDNGRRLFFDAQEAKKVSKRTVVEIQRFVCDHATPPIIEKLRSKGIAMNTYGVSAYYA